MSCDFKHKHRLAGVLFHSETERIIFRGEMKFWWSEVTRSLKEETDKLEAGADPPEPASRLEQQSPPASGCVTRRPRTLTHDNQGRCLKI